MQQHGEASVSDSPPERSYGRERREARRYSVRRPATVAVEDPDGSPDIKEEDWRGVIADLSTTGARIVGLAQRPEPGTEVRLRFSLLDGAKPVLVKATVVRHTKTGYAVHFNRIDPKLLRVFKHGLSRLAQQNRLGD
jgi:hypothetical protein